MSESTQKLGNNPDLLGLNYTLLYQRKHAHQCGTNVIKLMTESRLGKDTTKLSTNNTYEQSLI